MCLRAGHPPSVGEWCPREVRVESKGRWDGGWDGRDVSEDYLLDWN